jgi:uncharacterized membrane protein YdbT with pleckstrin-like domain
MTYPQKLLAPDETIEFETRPHWRALFVPIIVMLVTVFVTVFVLSWVVSNISGWEFLRWIIIGGGILILALWAVVPFLRWLTTEYTFTDRRIIVRSGIVTRHGKDMPLAKVNNVSFFVPMMGRLLNYGELTIQSAGENDGLTIEDVPDVEEIQRHIYELIESDEKRRRGHE